MTKKRKAKRQPAAAWKTPAVRARCVEAAEAATMPTFAIDDAMKSDEAMIRFAEESGESLDWLVRGLESHRRLKRDEGVHRAATEDQSPFDRASDMEEPLGRIKSLIQALHLIAAGEHYRGDKSSSRTSVARCVSVRSRRPTHRGRCRMTSISTRVSQIPP